ncbi:MAG: hypothetical protein JJU37_17155 [Balneolaceae bacterium]|nr:hypothetical protein [Balneolaceae bacterium]
MDNQQKTIQNFVNDRNHSKKLFTAGPASLLPENLTGLRPCFGRGDEDYSQVEESVLMHLKKMTGHTHIARLQGSASLALEIMSLNFLYGDVLVVQTGYYSDRMFWLAESAERRIKQIRQVDTIHWQELDKTAGNYDWIIACSTETSCGLKIEIPELRKTADRIGAKLMLDATASVGLENGHENADVISYSSCKGLFGITGACFIAFNHMPNHEIDSFYLNLATHLEKRMTGPYHSIASLADVLPKHNEIRQSVIINKKKFLTDYKKWVQYPDNNQPLLCTYVDCEISTNDSSVILYKPRSDLRGSVVCHLGEAHLAENAKGMIQNVLEVKEVQK